jgi:long-chain fatty acid transport protein
MGFGEETMPIIKMTQPVLKLGTAQECVWECRKSIFAEDTRSLKSLEHFPEKWMPVFRPKMRKIINLASHFKSIKMKQALASAAVFVAILSSSSTVQAGGFALREQNAAANGEAFAGTAAGVGGISSMFWNPAIVTMFPGSNWQQNFSLIAPQSTIKPSATTSATDIFLGGNGAGSGNIGQPALLPSGASSYQLNESIFVGLVTGSPYGLLTKPSQAGWAGQTYSQSSRVFSFDATPTIAYRFNEFISIGAGLQVEYFKTTLKSATGVAAGAPSAILSGDNTNIGFTAGATLTPFQGTNIGIGYRSGIDHKLDGNLITPAATTPITTTIHLPDAVTVGLSQKLTERLTGNIGFEWTDWSRFSTFPVYAKAAPVIVTTLPFQYKDGYYYSVGAEYKIDGSWTAKLGLAYEVSPITDANRATRVPDNDRIWTTIGASYNYNDHLSFDIAYAHAFVRHTPINLVAGNPSFNGLPFIANVDSSVDVVSVGLRYRFGDIPKAETPLVRKG